jgi:hypothetical protein
MVIVVEKVADVGVVDAGEQGEDSLLMDGSGSKSTSRRWALIAMRSFRIRVSPLWMWVVGRDH